MRVTKNVSLTLAELSSVAVATTSVIPIESATENSHKVSPEMLPVITPDEIDNEYLKLSFGKSRSSKTVSSSATRIDPKSSFVITSGIGFAING